MIFSSERRSRLQEGRTRELMMPAGYYGGCPEGALLWEQRSALGWALLVARRHVVCAYHSHHETRGRLGLAALLLMTGLTLIWHRSLGFRRRSLLWNARMRQVSHSQMFPIVVAYVVALASVARGSEVPAPRFVREIPWQGRGVWLKADTHVHTDDFSDGGYALKDVVAKAADHGCDVLAVTDHLDVNLTAATPAYFAAIEAARK